MEFDKQKVPTFPFTKFRDCKSSFNTPDEAAIQTDESRPIVFWEKVQRDLLAARVLQEVDVVVEAKSCLALKIEVVTMVMVNDVFPKQLSNLLALHTASHRTRTHNGANRQVTFQISKFLARTKGVGDQLQSFVDCSLTAIANLTLDLLQC